MTFAKVESIELFVKHLVRTRIVKNEIAASCHIALCQMPMNGMLSLFIGIGIVPTLQEYK